MLFSICGNFSSLCCFLPHTLYSVRDMRTSTGSLKNPKNLFSQYGNWISHSSTLYFRFLIVHCLCLLAKRLALSCCTAQKSISLETFCGRCDLDHPISSWPVIASSFPWLFSFSDISFFYPILCSDTLSQYKTKLCDHRWQFRGMDCL